MVDYISILPIINRGVQQLKIFGDKNQIGNVDMSTTPGIRHTHNLFNYCKNIEVQTKIRRIGQPMAN